LLIILEKKIAKVADFKQFVMTEPNKEIANLKEEVVAFAKTFNME
jgi:hypothetical protein